MHRTRTGELNPDINWGVSATGQRELANKPRYDITGERYGNTLSDDMFAIKNAGREIDRHTPMSYKYQDESPASQYANADNVMAPASGWGIMDNEIPTLKPSAIGQYIGEHPYLTGKGDFRDTAVGRKKFVGDESLPFEVYKDWSVVDDIIEFPEFYTDDQYKWAIQVRDANEARQRVKDLGNDALREDMNYLRTGEDRPWAYESARRDAELDPYTDSLVNYMALSPATIEQLVKMGVNRPVNNVDPNMIMDEDDASATLNFLLNAYRRMNEQTNY